MGGGGGENDRDCLGWEIPKKGGGVTRFEVFGRGSGGGGVENGGFLGEKIDFRSKKCRI